jgi:hypothetical protein
MRLRRGDKQAFSSKNKHSLQGNQNPIVILSGAVP